jgi:preprotein translocase SecE subunit
VLAFWAIRDPLGPYLLELEIRFMSNEIPNAAYRWAAGFFALFSLFFGYVFYELGVFLAQHYLPENASGFSLANPNFSMWNSGVAVVLAVVLAVILFANEKLKNYVVDVGDELTRVSWAKVKEVQKSTMIVVALCVLAATFLFAADQIFLKIVNFVLSFAA